METGDGSYKDTAGGTGKVVLIQTQTVPQTHGTMVAKKSKSGDYNTSGQKKMALTGGQKTLLNGLIPMVMALAITPQRVQQLQISSQRFQLLRMTQMVTGIPTTGQRSTTVRIVEVCS